MLLHVILRYLRHLQARLRPGPQLEDEGHLGQAPMPLQHAAQLRIRFLPSGELYRMQAYSVSPQTQSHPAIWGTSK